MEEPEVISATDVKPEPIHSKRISSETKSGSVGSTATPSPSSTPSATPSGSLSRPDDLVPGPSSQPTLIIDDKEEDNIFTDKDNGADFEDPIDRESTRGIFGWDTVDEISIPYLLRRGKKFVSVRIVECKLLCKYPPTIPDELAQKDPMVSHFITEAEASLLNEINTTHCDYEYGQSPFTSKDLIVDLDEFLDFFKIVKKNFPEDMLASIKGENQSPDVVPQSPPSSENSQVCGWVQINNTVSPYIIRSDGKEQVKLVPLSVIVYAAGLLTGSRVEGLLPTIDECTMLNAACRTAGFDFTFGRNTRLIAITEVVQRCQVRIFELPMSNPLQYAHYLDNRFGQPPPSSILSSTIRHPASYSNPMFPFASHMPMEVPSGAMLPNSNSFVRRYPPPRLSGAPSHMTSTSGPPNVSLSRLPGPCPNVNLDSKSMPPPYQQTMSDKLHNFDNQGLSKLMPGNSHYPPVWPMMPGQAPPAHKPVKGMHPPPDMHSALSSSTSSYQPLSLPPSPLLHSIASHPNASHPIYRNSGPTSSTDVRYPNVAISKSSLHQSQYPTPHSSSFGVNQFNSSLFARSESSDSNKQRHPISASSSSSSSHHHGISAIHHQTQSKSSVHNSVITCLTSQSANSAVSNSRNTPNSVLVKNITACLVNGKSISCLNLDTPTRCGKFCLVEAVSKLYFPTIPIMEFVKVLQVVLKANLHECTSWEESAFVQYYNLPVPKLKCNKMILVNDLQKYFPQLNYVFSKRMSEQADAPEIGDNRLKRPQSSPPPGPPSKQSLPKLENVVQKLQDKRPSQEQQESSSNANGGASSSVIVIDD